MASAHPNICLYRMPSLTILQKQGCFSFLWDVLLSRFQSDQGNTIVLTLSIPAALAALLMHAEWGHIFSRVIFYLRELRQIETFLHLPFRKKKREREKLQGRDFARDSERVKSGLTNYVILSKFLYSSDFSSSLSYIRIAMKFLWENAWQSISSVNVNSFSFLLDNPVSWKFDM